MSGIVGILNLDGAPVDRVLLGRMTDFMTFRGPDAQKIWIGGNVGFGHTLLKTTFESEHEHQPFTLDGQVWIVADARVDAQDDLIAKLSRTGDLVACRKGETTDVELILRAYHAWGEDCVDHLLGDFAFAIWDGPRQRLFCARDHMGVKPFYYAHIGRTVIFSNTLDCIRQHPAVSDKLNDLAIADFLLFEVNQNPETTSFADIQRIPPAHRATWSRHGSKTSRYWTLPIDEPVYFKRTDDYTDRFRELLDVAVSDRLRTNKIGIFMSGGLDSPTLAVSACTTLRKRSGRGEVDAFTSVIDGVDQNERYYAGLAASHLQIPIHLRDLTRRATDPDWEETKLHTAEPVVNTMNLNDDRAYFQTISSQCKVFFYGEGPDDALFYEWRAYLSYLFRQACVGRLLGDVCRHAISHRRIPLLLSVPNMLRDWRRKGQWKQNYPVWLNSTFESRLELRDRWEEASTPGVRSYHPVRPKAHSSFTGPLWESLFRSQDSEETAAPLEVRHPFVDLRLIQFMLRLPVLPWCRAKHILRRAMQGELPDAVIRRPKSPLTSSPAWDSARRFGFAKLRPAPLLHAYVDEDRVPRGVGTSLAAFRTDFRPRALNYWLHAFQEKSSYSCNEEAQYELAK